MDCDPLFLTPAETVLGKFVDDNFLAAMKTCAIDAVVGNNDRDEYVEIIQLVEAWKDEAFILDDTEIYGVTKFQYSLGRCKEGFMGFSPKSFKRSPISIGEPNICSADIEYFLENLEVHNELLGYNALVARGELKILRNTTPSCQT
jgi:hypothetical protein